MNYRNTINTSLEYYPGIFPNRLYVDEHLFATPGNGFKWKKGELVDVFEPDSDEYAVDPELDDRYNAYYPDTNHDFGIAHVIYPLSEYSAICEIPRNIKPDWAEAILHFVNYALEHKEILSPHKYNYQVSILKEVKEKMKKKLKAIK